MEFSQQYPFGVHYDAAIGGVLKSGESLGLFDKDWDSEKYAVEIYFQKWMSNSVSNLYFFGKFPSNGNNTFRMDNGHYLYISKGSGESSQSQPSASYYNSKDTFARLRYERDRVNSLNSAVIDYGKGNGPEVFDFTGQHDYDSADCNNLAVFGSCAPIALIKVFKDKGNGWEQVREIAPALVPAKSGGWVNRGNTDAVDGADITLYDVMTGDSWVSDNADASAFYSIYNITDLNGNPAGADLVLGTGNNVVNFTEGATVTELVVRHKATGKTFTPPQVVSTSSVNFDMPLLSDANMIETGECELVLLGGDYEMTLACNFTLPASYTRIGMQKPVLLNEISLAHTLDWGPTESSIYFYEPTPEFTLSVNDRISPLTDPTWNHRIWHLNSTGLREIRLESGYGSSSLGDPASGTPINEDTTNKAPTARINVETVGPYEGGQKVVFNALASTDPEDAPLTYSWSASDEVVLSSNNASSIEATMPVSNTEQTLKVFLKVNDGEKDSGLTEKAFQVLASTSDTIKPEIFIAGPNPLTIEHDATFVLPELTYSEPVEIEASVSGSVGTNAGTYTLTFYGAQDEAGNTAESVTYTVVRKSNVTSNDSVLSVQFSNMPDGSFETYVVNADTQEMMFSGTKEWVNGSAVFELTDVPAGTNCVTSSLGVSEGTVDRGVTV